MPAMPGLPCASKAELRTPSLMTAGMRCSASSLRHPSSSNTCTRRATFFGSKNKFEVFDASKSRCLRWIFALPRKLLCLSWNLVTSLGISEAILILKVEMHGGEMITLNLSLERPPKLLPGFCFRKIGYLNPEAISDQAIKATPFS